MASNDVEVLDPATTIEKLSKFASERVLNRRHFMAALGMTSAAAGAGLLAGCSTGTSSSSSLSSITTTGPDDMYSQSDP